MNNQPGHETSLLIALHLLRKCGLSYTGCRNVIKRMAEEYPNANLAFAYYQCAVTDCWTEENYSDLLN